MSDPTKTPDSPVAKQVKAEWDKLVAEMAEVQKKQTEITNQRAELKKKAVECQRVVDKLTPLIRQKELEYRAEAGIVMPPAQGISSGS